MKKNKTNSSAKKAKKALKKDLSDKIAAQIKITVGQFLPGVTKAEKLIEKAAKNLAKKLAKSAGIKVKSVVVKQTITPPPISVAKTPTVAKTTAVATETAPIKTTPAKPVTKPADAKATAKPAAKK